MGCNCKQKASQFDKYTENGMFEEVKGIKKIGVFFMKYFVIIIAFLLVIVIIPFFLLYMFFNMLIGKRTIIRLDKIFNKFKEKDE